eukprot:Gb_10378 [translate_table: standard]
MLRLKRSLRIPSTAWPDGIGPCDYFLRGCHGKPVDGPEGKPERSIDVTCRCWRVIHRQSRGRTPSGHAVLGICRDRLSLIMALVSDVDACDAALFGATALFSNSTIAASRHVNAPKIPIFFLLFLALLEFFLAILVTIFLMEFDVKAMSECQIAKCNALCMGKVVKTLLIANFSLLMNKEISRSFISTSVLTLKTPVGVIWKTNV